MASRELNWRQINRWGPGVYSEKPKLGPGGWDSHSYVVKEVRLPGRVAYCRASPRCYDWIFSYMAQNGETVSGINMWYARDRSSNPKMDDDYFAFFTDIESAKIFEAYADDMPRAITERGGRLFFKYLSRP